MPSNITTNLTCPDQKKRSSLQPGTVFVYQDSPDAPVVAVDPLGLRNTTEKADCWIQTGRVESARPSSPVVVLDGHFQRAAA